VVCHRLTQRVIGGRIIAGQGADVLCDSVVFENRTKRLGLTHAAMAMDRTESNQDVPKVIPCGDETGADRKQKVMTQ